MRKEHDGLGWMDVPDEAYYGVGTARALENFPVSGYRMHPSFIRGFGQVKQACAMANRDLGYLDARLAGSVIAACEELVAGKWADQIVVDAFQGGAGTSTNMNFNEVIANRALELMGRARGDYETIHPLRHVNMHQSTNDVYPTALKVAVLHQLKALEGSVSRLQESFQAKEQVFRDVLKVGRTQLQDAVPMTLGMTFGAFAEAAARDRWRIFKCRERIKQVNLGGTAIGTGLGAPREYIFKAAELLRVVTGLNVSRAENLVDTTQNHDAFVEVSGMLKACAANDFKIASDLRLLGSGPNAGLGEIRIPARQAGSTIMPGKVNPVILESVSQAALQVMSNDQTVGLVAALGQLELNQFLPLLAHNIMESLQLLNSVTEMLRVFCVDGIEAVPSRCLELVERSQALATILVPALGYERVEALLKTAEDQGISLLAAAEAAGYSGARLRELMSPKRMYKLGFQREDYLGLDGE